LWLKSGDLSKTIIEIWLLENKKKNTFVFFKSHFETKTPNWLNLARKAKKRLQ
jgi:hypothetical protein